MTPNTQTVSDFYKRSLILNGTARSSLVPQLPRLFTTRDQTPNRHTHTQTHIYTMQTLMKNSAETGNAKQLDSSYKNKSETKSLDSLELQLSDKTFPSWRKDNKSGRCYIVTSKKLTNIQLNKVCSGLSPKYIDFYNPIMQIIQSKKEKQLEIFAMLWWCKIFLSGNGGVFMSLNNSHNLGDNGAGFHTLSHLVLHIACLIFLSFLFRRWSSIASNK